MKFLKWILATWRTAMSQLLSTIICSNLTRCWGVYWNCNQNTSLTELIIAKLIKKYYNWSIIQSWTWSSLCSAALRSSGLGLRAACRTTARLGRSILLLWLLLLLSNWSKDKKLSTFRIFFSFLVMSKP
jgi:hypothetical protein